MEMCHASFTTFCEGRFSLIFDFYIDTIHVNEPTRAVISLQSQFVDDTSEGLSKPFYHKIDFVVFRLGESEPLYYSQKNDAGSHYGVSVEIDLLGAGDYVLHVRVIYKEYDMGLTLRVFFFFF
jgi:hypothetical protein